MTAARLPGTKGRRRISRALLAVLFVLLAVLFVAPMYWMFLSSARPQ